MLHQTCVDPVLLQSLVPAALFNILRHPHPPIAAIGETCNILTEVLTELVPFIPAPVLDLHLVQPQSTIGIGRYINGTLLLADVLGFSSLVAHVAQSKRQDSETLGRLADRLFNLFVEEIHRYGGGIVKFDGAHLIAVFDGTRLGSNHSTLAAAAALEMQRRLKELHATIPQLNELGLRIAIERGKVFITEVGDQARNVLVIAGRTVNRVAATLETAVAGDILLSEDTVHALPSAQTLHKKSNTYALLAFKQNVVPSNQRIELRTPAVPSWQDLNLLLQRIKRLRLYIPYRSAENGTLPALTSGEFRPVTVLFSNFSAFGRLLTLLELPALMEHDATIVGQVLNTYYKRMQQTVHMYGGTIHTIDLNSHGNRAMTLFGLPTAHTDDPSRAVQAALALRSTQHETSREITGLLEEWLASRPEQRSLLRVMRGVLHQRLGLATGIVYTGVVGTPQRREYTVIGPTIQVAGHIMSAAEPGEVLLSSMMQRAVSSNIDTQPVAPLKISGHSLAVPVFRAVEIANTAPTGDRLSATPFVGRQVELSRIREVATQALSGTATMGQFVAIVGDPGIGKSRVIDEAVSDIHAIYPDLHIIRELCQSYEQTTPYAPIRRLLRYILELDGSVDAVARETILRQKLEGLVPTWTRFTPLIGELLNIPLGETTLTQALNPEQRHDRLHDFVVALCCAYARAHRLVLVLDDLQWADSSTLLLLQRLASANAPLLLVVAYRRDAHIDQLWQQLAHCTMVELEELSAQESAAFVQGLLGGGVSEVLSPLLERAHGSPFLLEQTIRYLRDADKLRRDETGHWVPDAEIDSSTIPTAVEQLIVARLDQLPEDTRALIQIASVIGQRIDDRLLAGLERSRQEIAQCLDELSHAGFLVRDLSSGLGAYRFKQPLVRDVVYTSLLFAQRRELHARVASAIEMLDEVARDDYQGMLAEHFYLAEQWDRAFPHVVRAAEQAQARYANTEALALYQQACAIMLLCETQPQLSTLITLYESLGDVLAVVGNYEGARTHYERALQRIASSSTDQFSVQQAALYRKIGNTFEHQGKTEQAHDYLNMAQNLINKITPTDFVQLENARILSDQGWVYFRQNDVAQAQHLLTQAVDLLEPLAAYDEQARVLNRLGGTAYARGDLALAQTYVEQSLAASERSDNWLGQANALNNLGILTDSQGKTTLSIHYGLRAMQLYERMSSRRDMAIAAHNVAWTCYFNGENDRARQFFTQAIDDATASRDTFHQMRALLGLGRTATALGDWHAAERAILQSQFLALQLHLPADQLESYIALAELALQQGVVAVAKQHYEEAMSLAVDTQSEEYGRFQRLAARIAIAEGDLGQAIQLLTANEAFFVQLQNMPEARRTHALLITITANQPNGALPLDIPG